MQFTGALGALAHLLPTFDSLKLVSEVEANLVCEAWFSRLYGTRQQLINDSVVGAPSTRQLFGFSTRVSQLPMLRLQKNNVVWHTRKLILRLLYIHQFST